MKDDLFLENSKSQKNDFSWVFTEGHMLLCHALIIHAAQLFGKHWVAHIKYKLR